MRGQIPVDGLNLLVVGLQVTRHRVAINAMTGQACSPSGHEEPIHTGQEAFW